MGGDHKCPVCEATFTRPQHVARHMRSHTGDRPYKCQHCGDQFARSDLLSRHVNKCHANEKPLPTGNARRKGLTGATRATTSKQACDQCVQSSLPCDGANPCAKCVQRKCRCTFVKFHRQTAPVGPGHNPPAGVYSNNDFVLPTLPENAGVYNGAFGTFQAQDYAPSASHEFAPSWNPYVPQYPIDYYSLGDYHTARRLSSSTDFSDEHSVSSSSSSSNVHLPPEPIYRDTQQPYGQRQSGEGGFSNAFGLMSLEDPAVLAGLATDAAPFFSNTTTAPSANQLVYPHSADATSLAAKSFQPQPYPQQHHAPRPSTSSGTPPPFPAPAPHAQPTSPANSKTPSASRETETRELREFWKAYLRTPLSGPFSGGTPQGESTPSQVHPLQQDTYGGGYRRQRVNSLPSVRTPGPSVNLDQSPVIGGQRTTIHGNADDLRSYEAAVLARKTLVDLKIVPPARRRADKGKGRSTQSPSQITSTPSSLSNAFGTQETSSATVGGATLHPRPSVKRLASSILEPETSKRVRDSPSTGSNPNSSSASPASGGTGGQDFEGQSPSGSE